MKVNDVIRIGDSDYRILHIKDTRCFCINCDGKTMPVWIPADELKDCLIVEWPQIQIDLPPEQRRISHERFTMIAPILAFLTDDKERCRMMNRISSENGVSKQTLRRYLCIYLARHDIAALAPVRREITAALTKDQKNMRWALNKYFYTPNKSKLTEAYVHLLKERYCDAEGKLLSKYPSIRQFRYFEHKYRKQENYLISRNGLKNYQRNDRPLLGEGVQEFAPFIGVGMLDATVCDIYLVNKEGLIVGRPILVAGVDANTSLCLGYALLWEGGVYSLQQLMLNMIVDKKELCRRMGILIENHQWPVSALPGVMVTDMGAEYIGETFEQIAELGVTLINLPSFRPDLKGPIEKLFDLVQNSYKDALKGKGVVMPDFQERGAHDYRKDACLTLEEFERIIVRCIVHHNSETVLSEYPYSDEMIRNRVRPYACDIWSHKLSEPGANLISAIAEEITLTLLPRTQGSFGRYGLMVNKLRYHRDGYKEAYLNGGKCTVAYNPDDVSTVWLKTDKGFEEFQLIQSKHLRQTIKEVDEAARKKAVLVRSEREAALQAKIDLMSFIETRVAEFHATEKATTKGIRDNRKSEQRKQHKNIGRTIKHE